MSPAATGSNGSPSGTTPTAVATAPSAITTGTKTAEIRSASRWIGSSAISVIWTAMRSKQSTMAGLSGSD